MADQEEEGNAVVRTGEGEKRGSFLLVRALHGGKGLTSVKSKIMGKEIILGPYTQGRVKFPESGGLEPNSFDTGETKIGRSAPTGA